MKTIPSLNVDCWIGNNSETKLRKSRYVKTRCVLVILIVGLLAGCCPPECSAQTYDAFQSSENRSNPTVRYQHVPNVFYFPDIRTSSIEQLSVLRPNALSHPYYESVPPTRSSIRRTRQPAIPIVSRPMFATAGSRPIGPARQILSAIVWSPPPHPWTVGQVHSGKIYRQICSPHQPCRFVWMNYQ